MNILVICHYGLYRDLSYSFVHNQAREFAALGHRVRVIIPNGLGKQGRDGGRAGRGLLVSKMDGVELLDLRYVTLSSYGEKRFNTASAKTAVRLHWNAIFRDFTPDVIHAHTLGFDSELGAWLKKKLGCPLVVTTHGSDTNLPFERGCQHWLGEKCNEADAVVTVSTKLQYRLESCGTKTPVYTVHNGFVARHIPETAVRNCQSLIQVGNLVPSKRVDVTIRALALLRKIYPDMTLTVIGRGPKAPELEDLCRELGVSDAVCFTGLLPNDKTFDKLCTAGFFVMVSAPEGFGVAYLEAMAAGCVTVGAQGQGIGDIIQDGKNGFLVPVDDPEAIVSVVQDCLENPKKMEEIARQGGISAKDLTWSHNARRYLELFTQLMGSSERNAL